MQRVSKKQSTEKDRRPLGTLIKVRPELFLKLKNVVSHIRLISRVNIKHIKKRFNMEQ